MGTVAEGSSQWLQSMAQTGYATPGQRLASARRGNLRPMSSRGLRSSRRQLQRLLATAPRGTSYRRDGGDVEQVGGPVASAHASTAATQQINDVAAQAVLRRYPTELRIRLVRHDEARLPFVGRECKRRRGQAKHVEMCGYTEPA